MEIYGHNVITWYLVILNVVAILLYGWDKVCAIRSWWRVPELTLLLLALAGGSIGAMIAIQVFHHKTLHWKFKYGVPLILILQVAGLMYLFWQN
ncbi:DUF1294 domain-containing protein [Selenomonas ruminis]|uniref:DUF1294 domain-containing protein n=1 Tax=Selenomonas ruminis TaxID=2593411 RepID=A0A5D6WD48_9FIRM|nr:DUF1294 domain-containing protein [Selenomonas sp. mPRGC5]TYZ24899.1 DUF1294 domain-containing protein [Selenomonas sp. mPRGC5]